MRIGLVAIMVLSVALATAAQTAYSGGSSASSQGSGGGGSSQSGGGGKGGNGGGGPTGGGSGGGGGFSIESEMLAYKALESDSEAIACDVAVYLIYSDTSATSLRILPAARKAGRNESGAGPHWEPLEEICGYKGVGSEVVPPVVIVADDGAKPKDPTKPTDDEKKAQQTKMQGRQDTWGVIVLSSADPTIPNFQAWRLNMAIIGMLRQRAEAYTKNCQPSVSTPACPAQVGQGKVPAQGGEGARFAFPTVISEASSVVGLVQSVAQLFAVNESVAGVAGTIQDQALIDGIARHFRAMGIPVLAPGTYASFGLDASYDPNNGYDSSHSPFLKNLTSLIQDRIYLQGQIQYLTTQIAKNTSDISAANAALAKQGNTAEQIKSYNATVQNDTAANQSLQLTLSDVSGIATSIDSFVAGLLGGTAQSKPAQQSTGSQGDQGSKPASQSQDGSNPVSTQNQNQGQNQNQNQQASSPINAILAADGVIRRLNDAGDIYDWKVLTVKALESGGGVLTKSSTFAGSKVFFSGGAVATYALFQVNGALSCSGNVYDYDGYIREKDFAKEFRKPNISPDKQMIFYRGRCSNFQSNPKPKN